MPKIINTTVRMMMYIPKYFIIFHLFLFKLIKTNTEERIIEIVIIKYTMSIGSNFIFWKYIQWNIISTVMRKAAIIYKLQDHLINFFGFIEKQKQKKFILRLIDIINTVPVIGIHLYLD